MIRLLFVAGMLGLVIAGCLVAACPAVGTWQVVSVVDSGEEYTWKMVIKEDDAGKLSGVLSGEPGDFTAEDMKFENGTLTFKLSINDQTYTVESKISGSKLEGSFEGGGAKGTLKGTKE